MKPGYFYQKEGIDVNGIHPMMMAAVPIICRVFHAFDSPALCTSGLEGEHDPASLHYVGCAMDWRIWYVDDAALEELVKALQEDLGPDYDVVLEATHIHVEFDPK